LIVRHLLVVYLSALKNAQRYDIYSLDNNFSLKKTIEFDGFFARKSTSAARIFDSIESQRAVTEFQVTERRFFHKKKFQTEYFN
jgi:hypothetical protein